MKSKILFLIIFILSLLALSTACNKQNKTFQVNSFEECANAASYDGNYQVAGGVIPRFCTTPDGRILKEQIIQEQSGDEMGGGAGEIVNMSEVGLYKYPDLPLNSVPATPISLKFLAEHRSALNEQRVIAKGVVVAAQLKTVCPAESPDGVAIGAPCIGARILLADTADQNRDKNYDVIVFINDDENYKLGEVAEISAVVYSSGSEVSLQKIY